MLIDTHAHIHFDDYAGQIDEVLSHAAAAGVKTIICVGVDDTDSKNAIKLAHAQPNPDISLYATVGLHPHDANRGQSVLDQIAALAADPKVVAIGECGLDFFRNLSSPADQERALRFQIELALKLDKPMVWHVRDAFDQFFTIIDQYPGVTGIVHCFTSNRANMEKVVERGFLIALNGIMTFTKDPEQLEAAKLVPLSHLVLETDCPFLTPAPLRGKPNQPANLKLTAQFLAELRGETLRQLSETTTLNASKLLGI